MRHIPISKPTEARGRNGWFRVACIDLTPVGPFPDTVEKINISVRSPRAYRTMPPVYISLSRQDAHALATALQELTA